MLEFANEKEAKGESYTFCYDCNRNFGNDECFNCGYFDQEVENRLNSIEEPTEIQKDFCEYCKINLRENCLNEAIFYLKELNLL